MEPAAPTSIAPGALSGDVAALAARSLGASSLPAMQLLATEGGRATLSNVVSCALPRGASITTIARDGTPYAFAGSAGVAPGWAAHPPTFAERARVAACLHVPARRRSPPSIVQIARLAGVKTPSQTPR